MFLRCLHKHPLNGGGSRDPRRDPPRCHCRSDPKDSNLWVPANAKSHTGEIHTASQSGYEKTRAKAGLSVGGRCVVAATLHGRAAEKRAGKGEQPDPHELYHAARNANDPPKRAVAERRYTMNNTVSVAHPDPDCDRLT